MADKVVKHHERTLHRGRPAISDWLSWRSFQVVNFVFSLDEKSSKRRQQKHKIFCFERGTSFLLVKLSVGSPAALAFSRPGFTTEMAAKVCRSVLLLSRSSGAVASSAFPAFGVSSQRQHQNTRTEALSISLGSHQTVRRAHGLRTGARSALFCHPSATLTAQ
ncbi:hypothetical protein QQF64_006159, partial [Cirrhinus molitorella]